MTILYSITIEQPKRGLEVLNAEYVEFYLQCWIYNKRIESDASEPDKGEELVLSEDYATQLKKQKVGEK